MQRVSRGHQQNKYEWDQEEAWKIQRQMDWEIAKRFVGLSDHTTESNKRNALHSGL